MVQRMSGVADGVAGTSEATKTVTVMTWGESMALGSETVTAAA
jgi:hypothetical protein